MHQSPWRGSYTISKQDHEQSIPKDLYTLVFTTSLGQISEPLLLDEVIVLLKPISESVEMLDPFYKERKMNAEQALLFIQKIRDQLYQEAQSEAYILLPSQALKVPAQDHVQFIQI